MNKPSLSCSDNAIGRVRRALTLALLSLALAAPASAQSLWKEETSKPMVADKKARAVGDIVTILIQENNTTSKEQGTQTAKSSSVDASIASFLYGPAASGLLTKGGQYPALKYSSTTDFDGGGKISNAEKITARISVRVIDVLPNGNLLLEGMRQISFSGETQEAILRGVVRSEDVAANNTVFSYQVADATIKFISKGTLTDSQKKGWFNRFWDKVSPF
ncbi:MAG: flagellar basal body L-ring protein FlgH [Verrucomicrobiota bacterium]